MRWLVGPCRLSLLHTPDRTVVEKALCLNISPITETETDSLATQNLKSKLEQAVMFGDKTQNPLAFDLRLDMEGDLVTAAEKVSIEILTSGASEPASWTNELL